MSTAIKHAPKAPPTPQRQDTEVHEAPVSPRRPVQSCRVPAGPVEKRLASGGLGRGDSLSGRSSSRFLEDDPISADGLFFSQLLILPVGEEPDAQSFAGGSLDLSAKTEPMPTQLIDELAQRLPEQPPGPLNFTLLMPNLGKVRVNAEKTDNRWSIQVGFSRRDVLKRVYGHSRACRDALSQALGHDVDLDFHEDLQA
ncbi:type III secretion system HrpP C-terminal domain-containing protein [Pseudomonas viridiflava]|uniref:HrpP n=1 Tax=Pseudomonas viridiflava TaxID=33069 RepID=I6LCM6_PSEVI|nr:type III secretion system HrpP C-terminal domain-containing protein [Pseudomonas viridiflava]AAT96143.1 HrpP [Pseudomonas viridiflava]MBD8186154.1 flagellar hook-length control protein FliK [Pseudomonas viridiflava]MBD8200681.1 flagellar hook-length control protein FliK [Pseudomonas viridiflava]TKJ68349.1 type III secretion protein [Pseudomonas viridiflava]TKK32063.1 type III secretion protein [Pseudomonas viridiflava]